MAYIDTDSLVTRIRSVIEDGAGALRNIAGSRFSGDLPDGLSVTEETRRALVNPRVETTITRLERHPDSPPMMHTLGLYNIEVEVRTVRHFDVEHRLVDASRDLAKSLAIQDGDVISQAFEYTGNLQASQTGLVSGVLVHEGTDVEVDADSETAAVIVGIHTFTGILQVTKESAVSVAGAFSSGFDAGYS